MPLFGKSDSFSENPETREIQKGIAKEARDDQRNLDHSVQDLSRAERTHQKSVKAAQNAHHALDKAVEKEYNAAKAVNRAIHDHESTMAGEQAAGKKVELTEQHETRLGLDLDERRRQLSEQQHRKAQNDQVRESKLSQIHAQAADAADVRASSFENGGQQQRQPQKRASIASAESTGNANGGSTGSPARGSDEYSAIPGVPSGDYRAVPGVPSSDAAA
ncbi:hypothetical protein BV20DRAFT_966783 [Pilatotrama ljubarskyi]|nr:hypothetical protein BV20DRAFT_966783 [Pilatotrama ljubarskyi]